jgi:hypothetical protein
MSFGGRKETGTKVALMTNVQDALQFQHSKSTTLEGTK